MATTPPNPSKKQNTSFFSPRRGQIKAQIFESCVKTIVSAAKKAGDKLGRARRDDGGSSASEGPLPSGYNSDVNSDLS